MNWLIGWCNTRQIGGEIGLALLNTESTETKKRRNRNALKVEPSENERTSSSVVDDVRMLLASCSSRFWMNANAWVDQLDITMVLADEANVKVD